MKQGSSDNADIPTLRIAHEEMTLTVRQVRLASWQRGHLEASLDDLLDPEILNSFSDEELSFQKFASSR